MHLLITGICGFVGSSLARALVQQNWVSSVSGIDNFSRAGSELNRRNLLKLGIGVRSGDIRCQSDIDTLPKVDWVIDAAANPSVLAGVDGKTSPRQLLEHNLLGTINLLEYCRQSSAGFCLLSTSRVYSVPELARIEMETSNNRFVVARSSFSDYLSERGVTEFFPTVAPISLYGCTKLTSELLALEYHHSCQVPVWINRCGVMAGPGQFGHPAQGILAYWIHSFREKKPLKYIGFGGSGYQVRDCLHPHDLISLLHQQFSWSVNSPSHLSTSCNSIAGLTNVRGFMTKNADKTLLAELTPNTPPRILNIGGGASNTFSLAELSAWCSRRYGHQVVESTSELRPFDIPWLVMDSTLAEKVWGWKPSTPLVDVLDQIANFADANEHWLDVTL